MTVLIMYIAYSSTYVHRFNLKYINKTNTSSRNVLLSLLPKCQLVFSKTFSFVATSH